MEETRKSITELYEEYIDGLVKREWYEEWKEAWENVLRR